MNSPVIGYVSGGKWDRDDGDFYSDGTGFIEVAVKQSKPDLQFGETVTIYRGRKRRLTREEFIAELCEELNSANPAVLDAVNCLWSCMSEEKRGTIRETFPGIAALADEDFQSAEDAQDEAIREATKEAETDGK